MTQYMLTAAHIAAYGRFLRQEDRSTGTVEKYLRDVRGFFAWLDGAPVTQEEVIQWREYLLKANYAPVTVNSMLAALNGLFKYLGCADCRGKFIKIQRRLYRNPERELTRNEYARLVTAARSQGKERLVLLMEAICATGIRVSEVKHLTVEAARSGRAEVALKGKIRTILIPRKLARKLLNYARKNKTASGEIFLTGSGKPLSRRQISAEMKALCKDAGVKETKVFPHNLRHLFATVFYKACKDIARLADVLGHSSIETTRIYLLTSGKEHARALEGLGLIL